jgi:hypothetical protein
VVVPFLGLFRAFLGGFAGLLPRAAERLAAHKALGMLGFMAQAPARVANRERRLPLTC